MNLLHLLAALLLMSMLAFTPRAQAASLSTPIIDGLSGGTYKPLTTPALTGNNFVATGRVLIGGKWINIPGYVPPASTAAQAARISLFQNPWLIGAALLGWSNDAGLGSDGSRWTKSSGPLPFAPWQMPVLPEMSPDGVTSLMAQRGNQCPASGGAIEPYQQCIATYGSQNCLPSAPCLCCLHYPQHVHNGQTVSTQPVGAYGRTQPNPGLLTGGYEDYHNGCPAGYSGGAPGVDCQLTDPDAAESESRPATQDDFAALPAPPVQALAELAPQVGVPVDDPVYEPVDVDIGTPYTKPDGSTAQQRAKISPSGNGEVWIDTYEQPVTDSQGNPVPNAPPVDTPEPPAEQPTQCDKYPDTLGCARLGSIPDGTLPIENRSIALIQPVDIGNAGQCPAPMTATIGGMTIEWSFDPLCQYATALRPLVLALAWLSAGVIFIGGVRNG